MKSRLEQMDRPAFSVLPPVAPEPLVCEPDKTVEQLLARVDMLERRLSMLEAIVNHRDGLSRAVAILVEESTGEFTEPQLRSELYKRWPHLRPPTEHQQVAVKLHRMLRERQIVLITEARGPKPNVYARNEQPPARASQPGRKPGRPSGLYHELRSALAALPEQFTIDDVRAAMNRHKPIVGGDRHALHCLADLVKAGELEIVVKASSRNKQVWKRGAVAVSPVGGYLSPKEQAWRDLRRGMETPKQGD